MRIAKKSPLSLINFVALGAALLAIVALLVGVAVNAQSNQRPKLEPGQRLVTIFDQGEKRSVITEADTVGDTLKRAGIALSTGDIVEPAAETEFTTTDYTVNIYRAKPVMIIDGMRREQVISPYGSARDIVKHSETKLYDEDTVEMAMSEDPLNHGPGTQLIITRATPINLVLYGEKNSIRTQAKTVAELLDEKGVKLASDDTLSVDASAAIEKGMTIEIWRNGVQTITEEHEIDFPVRQIEDADKEVGYKEVQTPGKKGKKSVTYEVTMKNGQEVDRKEIQSVEVEAPSEQVEIVGAKPSFGGDFAAALAKLRSCEGGYNSWNPAGPYYGAYQFDQGTWSSVSSAPYGSASPAEQDAAARALYERRGWSPWPHCGAGLPDTYR